jgi:hypothetical protein
MAVTGSDTGGCNEPVTAAPGDDRPCKVVLATFDLARRT